VLQLILLMLFISKEGHTSLEDIKLQQTSKFFTQKNTTRIDCELL